MSKFRIGDFVIVSNPDLRYVRWRGMVGVINEQMGGYNLVKFDKAVEGEYRDAFNNHELDHAKSHIVTQILNDL